LLSRLLGSWRGAGWQRRWRKEETELLASGGGGKGELEQIQMAMIRPARSSCPFAGWHIFVWCKRRARCASYQSGPRWAAVAEGWHLLYMRAE